MTVFSPESGFLLIIFSNTDSMIYIFKIEFNKLNGFYKSV